MEGKVSNDITPESTPQIYSQKSCILMGRVSTNFGKNFKISNLGVLPFFSVFVIIEPYGRESFLHHL